MITNLPSAMAAQEQQQQLRLLGMWASPFVWRVKLALHLKGVPYEYVEEDLRNKSDLLLQSNPVHGKVPVLLHAGHPVCESLVILHYLDAAFPDHGPSILPADPHDRANQLFWVAYLSDTVNQTWLKVPHGKTEEEKEQLKRELIAQFQVMEASLKELFHGKDFFGGDTFGYLDIVLGCILPWLETASTLLGGAELIGEETTPFLAAWKERFLSTEAAKEVFPDAARLKEYFFNVVMLRFTGAAA